MNLYEYLWHIVYSWSLGHSEPTQALYTAASISSISCQLILTNYAVRPVCERFAQFHDFRIDLTELLIEECYKYTVMDLSKFSLHVRHSSGPRKT